MCGRVVVPEQGDIVRELRLKLKTDRRVDRNINVPPTLPVPVMIDKEPEYLNYFRWSLIPWYSEVPPKYSTSNAKIENLQVSGTWKQLVGTKHCIIITEGFYEWNYDDPIKKKGSHPHLIRTRGEKFTFMAGLWDIWKEPETGEIIESCTIITQPANEMMAAIHNTKARMPAILKPDEYKIWLDPELPTNERLSVINGYDNDFLQAVEINKVGDVEEFEHVVFY